MIYRDESCYESRDSLGVGNEGFAELGLPGYHYRLELELRCQKVRFVLINSLKSKQPHHVWHNHVGIAKVLEHV